VAEGWEALDGARGADDVGTKAPVRLGADGRAGETSRKGGRGGIDRVVTVDVTGHGSFIVVLDDEGAIFGVRRGSVSTKVLEHFLAQRVLDERPHGEIRPALLSVDKAQVKGGSSDVHGIVELRQRDELQSGVFVVRSTGEIKRAVPGKPTSMRLVVRRRLRQETDARDGLVRLHDVQNRSHGRITREHSIVLRDEHIGRRDAHHASF